MILLLKTMFLHLHSRFLTDRESDIKKNHKVQCLEKLLLTDIIVDSDLDNMTAILLIVISIKKTITIVD